MNPVHDVRGNPRHTKISILPQFRTSDPHEVTRRFKNEVTNLHFTTVLDVRWARNDERVARRPKPIRISPQFWTSDEHETMRGLPDDLGQFAFHLSFGRPMSTKRREGCPTTHSFGRPMSTKRRGVATTRYKIHISPQFWTSDEHETTRGLRRRG